MMTTKAKLTEEQILKAANDYRAKYAAGTLSPRLVARLEGIPGWSWDDELGHPDPKADPEAWMADIRARYAAGTLAKWKSQRVEKIAGWAW
jgi:hypothetical protein